MRIIIKSFKTELETLGCVNFASLVLLLPLIATSMIRLVPLSSGRLGLASSSNGMTEKNESEWKTGSEFRRAQTSKQLGWSSLVLAERKPV